MSSEVRVGSTKVPREVLGWLKDRQGQQFAQLWLLSALGGAVAISLSQGYELRRLILPVGIMLFYALVSLRRAAALRNMPALRATRIAQLADSLYFLGFLWTLWALIDTFVFKQLSATESVFRVFGYALVTTATGMFLRLLLLQSQYTVGDQSELAELTIEQKLAQFSTKLSEASSAIEGFRARAESAASDFQANTETAVAGWTRSLNQAFQALNSNVSRISAESQEIGDAVRQIHQTSAAELQATVAAALKVFVERLQPPLTKLVDVNTEFVLTARAGTDRLSATIGRGRDDIERTMNNFHEQVQASSLTVEKSLTDLGQRIRNVRIPEDLVVSLASSEVRARVNRATADFAELGRTLREALAAARELSTELRRRPAERRSFLRRVFGGS